jgi:hypothetical protein
VSEGFRGSGSAMAYFRVLLYRLSGETGNGTRNLGWSITWLRVVLTAPFSPFISLYPGALRCIPYLITQLLDVAVR